MTILFLVLENAGRLLMEWAQRQKPDYHDRPIVEWIREAYSQRSL